MSKWPFKIKYSSFVKRPRHPSSMQPLGVGKKASKDLILAEPHPLTSAFENTRDVVEGLRAKARPTPAAEYRERAGAA
jgi:hypothetical protein